MTEHWASPPTEKPTADMLGEHLGYMTEALARLTLHVLTKPKGDKAPGFSDWLLKKENFSAWERHEQARLIMFLSNQNVPPGLITDVIHKLVRPYCEGQAVILADSDMRAKMDFSHLISGLTELIGYYQMSPEHMPEMRVWLLKAEDELRPYFAPGGAAAGR